MPQSTPNFVTETIRNDSRCNNSVRDLLDHHLESSNGKSKIRYGASCTSCRRRKQRCDGHTPRCARCQRLKEKCIYENNARNLVPSQSVPLLLQTFHFLQTLTDPTAGPPDFIIRQLIRQYLEDTPLPSFATDGMKATPSGGTLEALSSSQRDDEWDNNAFGGRKSVRDNESENEVNGGVSALNELLMHMSLADDGQMGHFGVSSLFWEAPPDVVIGRLKQHAQIDAEAGGSLGSGGMTRQPYAMLNLDDMTVNLDDKHGHQDESREVGSLKVDAAITRTWEMLVWDRLELERGPEVSQAIKQLLETYFCWQHASYCIIYRPAFMRDMALGGQYFNEFLLQVICACSIRQCSTVSQACSGSISTGNRDAMEAGYLSQAKTLLSVELDRPSSIPTIQGLLLLGQRDCAHGNLSQGWMYTGMAFRAMRDMGIHLDCSRLSIFGFGTLTVEDREIRRRLFWSAFTWDKIISVSMGRTPTFNAHQTVWPGHVLDDTEDHEIWQPKSCGSSALTDYPPRKCFTITTFKHFATLCEIIQTIIMRLYVGRPRHLGIGRFIDAVGSKLRQWYDCLPVDIKMNTSRLPEHCPPPHIFSVNSLYLASWILLYRIFIPDELRATSDAPLNLIREASATCSAKAEEMHQLFKLYAKSFGLNNMTYTMVWSMYSSATINAIDFQSDDPIVAKCSASRLSMSLYVLEQSRSQIPGAQRSIDILKHRLRRSRWPGSSTTVAMESGLLGKVKPKFGAASVPSDLATSFGHSETAQMEDSSCVTGNIPSSSCGSYSFLACKQQGSIAASSQFLEPSLSSSTTHHNDQDCTTGPLAEDIDDWNMFCLPTTDDPKIDMSVEFTGNNHADLDHNILAVASCVEPITTGGRQRLPEAGEVEPADEQQSALFSFF